MDWLRRMFRWNRRRDAELAQEMEAHRTLIEDELVRTGLSPHEAAAESRRRLGNTTLMREEARDVWITRWFDRVRQYLQYGVRGLRREPLFALTAILTLGLGTAATTTVFSVVDAEIWRPLPYPDANRLVQVYSRGPELGASIDGITLAELADWRRAPGLQQIAAAGSFRRRTLQLDHAESISTSEVTANYFSILGRPALRGRVFTDADARGSDAAILTNRGWRRIFDATPAIIGRSVVVDGQTKTIVGVVADDETLGPDAELYVPIDERPSDSTRQYTRAVSNVFGRLAAGASPDAVRDQVQVQLTHRAETDADRRRHTVFVEDLGTFYRRGDARQLYFFLGAALLVLALTVANTAGLVLSRALRRASEFALRGALGGGTSAIAMQLAVESALLVLPGCALGLWLASQAVGVAGAVLPAGFLLRGTRIPLDLRVFAFCGVLSLVTVAGLALVPLRLARRAGQSAIGSGYRTSERRTAGRARAVLQMAQVALTVVLLVVAGMFLKTFVLLQRVPLGFEPASGWSARVTLGRPRYADDGQRRAYADALVERARAIPGVAHAAIATSSPLASGPLALASDPGRPGANNGAGDVRSIYRAVSGDYFRTIGTPIVWGRAIETSDTLGSPTVAVVNEQFVRRLFPDADPIGKSIEVKGRQGGSVRNVRATIVGIAADIKEVGLNEVPFADVYVPYAQGPLVSIELLVRGQGDDASMTGAIRSAFAAVDPTIPVVNLSPLTRRVEEAARGARFNFILVAGFAIVAVVIAAIGIYGTMAYATAARWREFGVRLALGATPSGLMSHALWQATRLGVTGGAIGVGVSLLLAVMLGDALYLVPGKHDGMLFGVKTTDPLTLISALMGVVAVALLAGAVPARRVARVDPVMALRAE